MHAMAGTGRVIAGRYRLKEPIGRGAMGTVWRGWDEILDREVAVKELRISENLPEEERAKAYQRTHREARTAARLSHPGLVTVFDVAEEDGRPWIVMELVHARSLDQIIAKDGPLAPPRAAEAGRQLLSALATAHAAGVLHRDVKPSNVLLSDAGRAVLTDFGIATFQGDPRLTQTGMVMGSPGFTAPERIQGNPATPASDLWSLGATLYAAVEGHGPFDQVGGAITTMSAIINTDPPTAPIAAGLGAVIDGLLRRNPAERPDAATAARMLGAIGPLPDGSVHAGYTPTASSYAPVLPRRAESGAGSPGAGAPGVDGAPEAAATSADVVNGAAVAAGALEAAGAAGGGGAPGAGGAFGPGGVPGAGVVVEAARGVEAGGSASAAAGGAGGAAAASGAGGAAAAGPAEGAAAAGPAEGIAAAGLAGSASPGAGNAGAATALSGASVDVPAREEHDGTAGAGAGPAREEHNGTAGAGALTAAPSSLVAPAPRPESAPTGWASPPPPSATAWPSVSGNGGPGPTAAVPPQSGTLVAGMAGPAGPGSLSGPAGPGRRGNGRRNVLIAVGVLVLLIAAAAGVLLLRSHGTNKPAGKTSLTAPGTITQARTPVAAAAGAASTGPLPSGWRWYTVPAAAAGTNAGFKLAIPSGWQVYAKGNGYYFEAPGGNTFLQIDLTPHTKYSMVAEARYLAGLTQKEGKFPGYANQTIRAANIRGYAGAAWGFTWQDPTLGRIRALDLMYIARTLAGQQSFALYMSSPDTAFDGSLATFTEEMRTFQPVR